MTEPEAPVATEVAARTWRGIDELARLVGAYCWVEGRVFALTGAWASSPGHADTGPPPELRVFCAAVSRRHGALAECWAARLPVRAGVDAGALVEPPGTALATALDELAAAPVLPAAAALVGSVLPRLRAAYGVHLGDASAASEAPVMEVLVRAHRELGAEISGGAVLSEQLLPSSGPAAPLVQTCERAFDSSGVFPAVRAS